jgi:hypothetical protein
MIGVANPRSSLEARWTPTWTPRTALYVTVDDLLKAAPQLAPWRPRGSHQAVRRRAGHLAVMQALLGFTSKARWLR